MMKLRKLLAMLLAFAMVLGLLTACSGGASEAPAEEAAEEEPAAAEEEAPAEEESTGASADTPLVVGYSNFNSKFSPFFAETAYDRDAVDMTQIMLLETDRVGQVVYDGIEGETYEYNGTEYTYNSPSKIEVTENEDGTVYYDITLRDGMTFSDGEPVTIDDVIFNMYVLCDPTYDGSATLFSQPIEGLEAYRSGMSPMWQLLVEKGEDNTDFTNWTEDQQKSFWESYNGAKLALAKEIVDFCKANGYNEEGDSVAACAANWGYELEEGATEEDFANAIIEAYGGDINAAIGTENAGSTTADLFPNYSDYLTGIETGESAPNITGIQKTGDNTVRVVTTQVDATTIYQLGFELAPMHYYGDKSLYDYDNNQFGFPKGDLSSVRAKTTEPMGAGPYKFVKFDNGVISFEANESYYKGAPKTKYVNFREVSDQDKMNGIITGDIDITDPSWSKDTAAAVSKENGGDITGDKITTSTVDNLGYGYIGMNVKNVAVGGEPGSDASKNLRKALATIFAVYRDVAIDSYYGDAASVINYPISNTSWAAPQSTDEGYRVAFSTDVEGNDIYTSEMSSDDKYAAAKEAALGFFEAAGYTVADGKVTAAPEGAKLEYEAMIPADGNGDHPSFMLLTEASEAFKEIGINLIVNDLTDSSELWTKLEAGQGEIWCAAWGATIDPDMYQIYYSGSTGQEPGGSNYMYSISDPELDQLILDARASTDQAYRKEMYKACLDIVIDWACEVPIYQRQNAIIFSSERVNLDTVTPDITTFYGWLKEIEKVELK